MNKYKIVKHYDEIIDDNIFGNLSNTKCNTDCFKYCPYLRIKRTKKTTTLNDLTYEQLKEDFKKNETKWINNANYKIFLEAFELIKPQYELKYDESILNHFNDLFNNIHQFENEIRLKTQAGAGMFFTYDKPLTMMKKIIEFKLINIQALYIFNYHYKQIILNIFERINDFKPNYKYSSIWIDAFDKWLIYDYYLNWYIFF